jgi:hypothetical protein
MLEFISGFHDKANFLKRREREIVNAKNIFNGTGNY